MTMGCSTTMMIAVTSMAVALQRGLRVQRKTPRGCAPRMGKALDHFYQGLPRPCVGHRRSIPRPDATR
jgi:hypothetical protein